MQDRIAIPDDKKNNLITATKQHNYSLLTNLLDDPLNNVDAVIDGETALMVAAKHGYNDCLKLLLNKGADKNKQDNDGYTALMFALGSIHLDSAQLLIAEKANLEIRNNDGDSALTLLAVASTKECYDAVGILLNAGADISVKNNDGSNALDIATEHNYKIPEIASLLLNYGLVTNNPAQLLRYLQYKDKNNECIYSSYHLFHQQQENLRQNTVINSNRVLSDNLFDQLSKEVEALALPAVNNFKKLRSNLIQKLDLATAKYLPLDLVKLTSDYDNPYQRFGIFKYCPVDHQPEPEINEGFDCKKASNPATSFEKCSSSQSTEVAEGKISLTPK